MNDKIGGLKKGDKVTCIEGFGHLNEGQTYTLSMNCLSTDNFTCLEEEEVNGIAWRVDRFIRAVPRPLKQGDRLICVEGNDFLKEGKVYTFDKYNDYNDYFIFLKEHSGTSWDKDRFVATSTKGVI